MQLVDISMIGKEQEPIDNVVVIPAITYLITDCSHIVIDPGLIVHGNVPYGRVYPRCPFAGTKDRVEDQYCNHPTMVRQEFYFCGFRNKRNCPLHMPDKDVY
jgi:hypothetical protein